MTLNMTIYFFERKDSPLKMNLRIETIIDSFLRNLTGPVFTKNIYRKEIHKFFPDQFNQEHIVRQDQSNSRCAL